MTKPRFKISVSTDEDTGKLLAVYIRIREGQVEDTLEVDEDRAFADYDAAGQLLGVELLAPCKVEALNNLVEREPAEVQEYLRACPPRAMVLA
jgi:uncharacterized protein YuzE